MPRLESPPALRYVERMTNASAMFDIGGVGPRTGHLYNYIETYAGGQGAMHVRMAPMPCSAT